MMKLHIYQFQKVMMKKISGDWFKLTNDPLFEQLENSFTFDYEYLIQKYDLVSKRSKGIFDHVWIL